MKKTKQKIDEVERDELIKYLKEKSKKLRQRANNNVLKMQELLK